MPKHWQANLNRPYADVVPDDCTCSWINYSDNGGWYLQSADPTCPVHGHAPQGGE
jgi:hypothetical protein